MNVLYYPVGYVLYVFVDFWQNVHAWKGMDYLRLGFFLVHREN